jgi:hypothetical protein
MKLRAVVVLTILFANSAFADTTASQKQELPKKESLESQLLKGNPAGDCKDIKDKHLLAKRGCCSWHGGVCDCKNARVVCCDGSYSPSCTCHHEDKITVTN